MSINIINEDDLNYTIFKGKTIVSPDDLCYLRFNGHEGEK